MEFKNKYRIVAGGYEGKKYVVQVKRWWWPFWLDHDFNKSDTLEEAQAYIKHKIIGKVYEEGDL